MQRVTVLLCTFSHSVQGVMALGMALGKPRALFEFPPSIPAMVPPATDHVGAWLAQEPQQRPAINSPQHFAAATSAGTSCGPECQGSCFAGKCLALATDLDTELNSLPVPPPPLPIQPPLEVYNNQPQAVGNREAVDAFPGEAAEYPQRTQPSLPAMPLLPQQNIIAGEGLLSADWQPPQGAMAATADPGHRTLPTPIAGEMNPQPVAGTAANGLPPWYESQAVHLGKLRAAEKMTQNANNLLRQELLRWRESGARAMKHEAALRDIVRRLRTGGNMTDVLHKWRDPGLSPPPAHHPHEGLPNAASGLMEKKGEHANSTTLGLTGTPLSSGLPLPSTASGVVETTNHSLLALPILAISGVNTLVGSGTKTESSAFHISAFKLVAVFICVNVVLFMGHYYSQEIRNLFCMQSFFNFTGIGSYVVEISEIQVANLTVGGNIFVHLNTSRGLMMRTGFAERSTDGVCLLRFDEKFLVKLWAADERKGKLTFKVVSSDPDTLEQKVLGHCDVSVLEIQRLVGRKCGEFFTFDLVPENSASWFQKAEQPVVAGLLRGGRPHLAARLRYALPASLNSLNGGYKRLNLRGGLMLQSKMPKTPQFGGIDVKRAPACQAMIES